MIKSVVKLCLPKFSDFTRVFSLVKVLCNRPLEFLTSIREKSGNLVSMKCWEPCKYGPVSDESLLVYNKLSVPSVGIRVVATVGGTGRGRPALTISARHNPKNNDFRPALKKNFFFFFF